ncbi:hypothetical protein N658DRAFT_66348 [Parathielavia hyrcaniae]|uniref:Uncharacterized protein n=1 Tax=Parathielavia hyrcaniae TaxID=113614 RepID=A0AAN6SX20_9PEZI|nr:hypothetical protein N658DRAFT_66348 [Parathielavia hyrcaniae]
MKGRGEKIRTSPERRLLSSRSSSFLCASRHDVVSSSWSRPAARMQDSPHPTPTHFDAPHRNCDSLPPQPHHLVPIETNHLFSPQRINGTPLLPQNLRLWTQTQINRVRAPAGTRLLPAPTMPDCTPDDTKLDDALHQSSQREREVAETSPQTTVDDPDSELGEPVFFLIATFPQDDDFD